MAAGLPHVQGKVRRPLCAFVSPNYKRRSKSHGARLAWRRQQHLLPGVCRLPADEECCFCPPLSHSSGWFCVNPAQSGLHRLCAPDWKHLDHISPGHCFISDGLMNSCSLCWALTPLDTIFPSESRSQGVVWQRALYLSYGHLVLFLTVVSFLSPISHRNSE